MDYAVVCTKGVSREINEDYFYAGPIRQEDSTGYFVVADGMGGHSSGEVASKMAVKELIEYFQSQIINHQNVVEKIREGYQRANQKIYQESLKDEKYSGMGTTMVVALVMDRRIYIANAGDSRAYYMNQQGIQQITRDHSYVQELVEKGAIDLQQAKNHPKRNMITRAVGTEESIQMDFYELEVQLGDRFLLCSDGLSDAVSQEAIGEILNQNEKPKDCCEALTKAAQENGSRDDITAICVNI